jgi:type IV pilus biogenesis protein CpaD/CtpE
LPRLYNPKHEAFAQAVAADMGLSDAYERAGFVRRRGNPNRLARRPKVKARIEELQSLVLPVDLANLEYLQAKTLAIGAQIPDAASNRDAASRLANDLRRIARALDQYAGTIEVVPLPSTDRTNGRQTDLASACS